MFCFCSFPLLQVILAQIYFFTRKHRVIRVALYISVLPYLLPVNQNLSARQIGYGAVTVLLSWLNLIQFLQLVPFLGIYIILVQKIFCTLMKVRIVSIIYTIYILTRYIYLSHSGHTAMDGFPSRHMFSAWCSTLRIEFKWYS